MNDLIISVPKLQSLRKRVASTLLTFVFWAIWFYLWVPLVTLVAWLLGIDSVYFQMIELQGLSTLLDQVGFFAIVIACMGLTLGTWAFYNFIRFRGADYRKPFPAVSDQELSAFFKVDQEILTKSKASRSITVRFTDSGQIAELLPELDSIEMLPETVDTKGEAEITP